MGWGGEEGLLLVDRQAETVSQPGGQANEWQILEDRERHAMGKK